MAKLEDYLLEMVERKASDLFIKAGQKPIVRVDGILSYLDYAELGAEDTRDIAYSLMNDEQLQRFEMVPEMDLAVGVRGIGRFRVSIFRQRGSVSLVFRYVTNPSFSFEELGLPLAVKQLAEKQRGLVLVTGTTGSGKSTTLAAMINHINAGRRCHIVTIEDPIEFLHQDNQAIINQREVGFDTRNFSDALKHVLRQSPDVILIGEMRDLETIQTALAAAETGHSVLSTLHTMDAVQTVERIINYFPAYLHPQIRMELSLCLNGVISMRLLPRGTGKGRVPACEVMICTPTIRKILHEGRTIELKQHIQAGTHVGMQTFDQALTKLVKGNLVRLEDAMNYASSPDEFKLMVAGITTGSGKEAHVM